MSGTSERDNEIKSKCCIADSSLCKRLGTEGCYSCYIRTLKGDSNKQDALQRWETTLSLLPQDIDSLHDSDDCQFCKGTPEKKDGYATLEMANPEPYAEKGMFFGFGKKVRVPVGSLVNVQVAICKRCRKAFRVIDLMQLITMIVGIAVGIVVVAIPTIGQPLAEISPVIPLLVIVGFGVAGFYLGDQVALWYAQKVKDTVKIDLTEIPQINKMIHRDWFFFQMTKEKPKLFFTKKMKQPRLFCEEEKRPDNGDDNDFDPLDNINI